MPPYNTYQGGYPGMMDSNWGGYQGPPSTLSGVPPQMPVPPMGAAGQGAVGSTPYTGGLNYGANDPTAGGTFSPLDDPREAVYRALLNRGINPRIGTWGVDKLLQKADDIVRGLVGKAAMGGQQDILTGPGFQDALNSVIGGAVAGTSGVMPGAAEGRAGLRAINNILNGVIGAGGQGSEGSQLLQSLFGKDPQAAQGLIDSLLYGSLSPTVHQAMRRNIAFMPYDWNIATQTPGGAGEATRRSALDILLSGIFSGGQGPTGGPAIQAPPPPAAGALQPTPVPMNPYQR